MKKKKIKGFTLIELIIVIGIISILTLTILFNTQKIKERQEITEFKSLVAAIKSTKNIAIISNQKQAITFNSGSNSYIVYSNDNEIELRHIKFYKEDARNNANEFVFTHNGKPGFNYSDQQTAGTIVLKGKHKKYIIFVSPVTGKIRTEIENEI